MPRPRQIRSPVKAQAQVKPKPMQSPSQGKAQTQEQNNISSGPKFKLAPHLTASCSILGKKLYTEILVTRTRLYLSLTVMAFSLTVLLAERSVGCSSYRRQYKKVQGSYR